MRRKVLLATAVPSVLFYTLLALLLGFYRSYLAFIGGFGVQQSSPQSDGPGREFDSLCRVLRKQALDVRSRRRGID